MGGLMVMFLGSPVRGFGQSTSPSFLWFCRALVLKRGDNPEEDMDEGITGDLVRRIEC